MVPVGHQLLLDSLQCATQRQVSVEEYQVFWSSLRRVKKPANSQAAASAWYYLALFGKRTNVVVEFSGAKPRWLDDRRTKCCECLQYGYPCGCNNRTSGVLTREVKPRTQPLHKITGPFMSTQSRGASIGRFYSPTTFTQQCCICPFCSFRWPIIYRVLLKTFHYTGVWKLP